MNRLDPTAMLRGYPLFTDLGPSILKTIAGLCRVLSLREGETLFQKGDAGDSLYGICSGQIAIELSAETGATTTLALLGPGDLFGEIALLDGCGRTADAVATTPTELFTLRRTDVLNLMSCEPSVGMRLIEVLCQRLRSMTAQAEHGLTQKLENRIAARLLQLFEQSGPTLAITQDQLARSIGVSRESVNKQLQCFAAAGYLALMRGRIILYDAAALKAIR